MLILECNKQTLGIVVEVLFISLAIFSAVITVSGVRFEMYVSLGRGGGTKGQLESDRYRVEQTLMLCCMEQNKVLLLDKIINHITKPITIHKPNYVSLALI